MNFYAYFISFIAVTYIFSLEDQTPSEVRTRFGVSAVIYIIILLIVEYFIK